MKPKIKPTKEEGTMFKKFLRTAFPVLSAAVLTGCYEPAERGSSGYGYHALLVADRWGNGNGTAEPGEIEYLLNYFEYHRQAPCLGHYPWWKINGDRVGIELYGKPSRLRSAPNRLRARRIFARSSAMHP